MLLYEINEWGESKEEEVERWKIGKNIINTRTSPLDTKEILCKLHSILIGCESDT